MNHVRTTVKATPPPRILTFNSVNVVIFEGCILATKDGREVRLGPTERAILSRLIERQGEIIPPEKLVEGIPKRRHDGPWRVRNAVWRINKIFSSDLRERLIVYKRYPQERGGYILSHIMIAAMS